MDIRATSKSDASNKDTAMYAKHSGTIGMRCLVGLLQLSALVLFGVIVHNIDAKTQANCRMIAVHSDQLSEHENNFQKIYLGTFSRDFAGNLSKEISSER
jgi:hypothetical protein